MFMVIYLFSFFSRGVIHIRGDVKIHWLQPPYLAAICRQLIKEKLYIAVECCSNLAAAMGYGFGRLALDLNSINMIYWFNMYRISYMNVYKKLKNFLCYQLMGHHFVDKMYPFYVIKLKYQ